MNTPIVSLEPPANLRVADVIAKTARVTLKDTLRVLAALDAVSCLYDRDPLGMLEDMPYDFTRPTPEQVAACELAFFTLREPPAGDHANTIAAKLRLIRSLA